MKRISMAVAIAMGAIFNAGAQVVQREKEIVPRADARSHRVMRDIASPNGGVKRPGHFAAAHKRAAIKRRNLRLHPRR